MPNSPNVTPMTPEEVAAIIADYCCVCAHNYSNNDYCPTCQGRNNFKLDTHGLTNRLLATLDAANERIAELTKPPHCIEVDGMHQCSHCGTSLRADSPDAVHIAELEQLVAAYRTMRFADSRQSKQWAQADVILFRLEADTGREVRNADKQLAIARAETPNAGGKEKRNGSD